MTDIHGAQPGANGADVDLGLSDVFAVLIARKWTVLGVALLVTAASVFSASRQATTYSSKASVIVTSAAQTSIEALQLLATEKRLARSRPVAAIVVEDLNLSETPEELLDNLSVRIPLDTQLLEFSYTASTPEAAERLTQGFVDAHMKYQAELLDGLVASTRAIDSQIDGLREELENAQTRVANASTTEELTAATTEVNSLTAQISALEQKRTTLLTAAPVASTISEPATPAEQNSPPLVRAAVVGLLAGLVLGAFVAGLLELLSRRRSRNRGQPAHPAELDTPAGTIFPAAEFPAPAREAAFPESAAWPPSSYSPRGRS
jgi:uncharacterized protein involved in exopolysaccharide biosynthesis